VRALLIAYDLNKPGQNYEGVHEAIKALGAWWHYLESTWIVATRQSPDAAWSAIRSVFDDSDRCLVIDITGDSYQGWLTQDAWDWIHEHVDTSVRRV
jgi:hypothetical protein